MLQRCIAVVLLVLLPAAWAQCSSDADDRCTSTCNGTKLGILFTYPISFTTSDSKYTYWFDPCNGYLCGYEKKTKDVAMCQVQLDNNATYNLGSMNKAVWYINSTNPLVFTVKYTGGDTVGTGAPRFSLVTFKSGQGGQEGEEGLKFVNQTGNAGYEFTVTIPNSGGNSGGDISGWIGLVFISLTIAAFITYFIVGGVIMYSVKGARGLEVIPNWSFWRSLPFLLKDGFFFVISPCYRREGYEKI